MKDLARPAARLIEREGRSSMQFEEPGGRIGHSHVGRRVLGRGADNGACWGAHSSFQLSLVIWADLPE